jgi:hypothetical protein
MNKRLWIGLLIVIVVWYLWKKFVLAKQSSFYAVSPHDANKLYDVWKRKGTWYDNMWKYVFRFWKFGLYRKMGPHETKVKYDTFKSSGQWDGNLWHRKTAEQLKAEGPPVKPGPGLEPILVDRCGPRGDGYGCDFMTT